MKTKETETFHEFRQEVKIPRKSRKALESETRNLPQSDTCEPVEARSGAFWVNYMKTMKGRMENAQQATQKEKTSSGKINSSKANVPVTLSGALISPKHPSTTSCCSTLSDGGENFWFQSTSEREKPENAVELRGCLQFFFYLRSNCITMNEHENVYKV